MSATIQHTTTDTDDKEVELVKKTQRRIANISHSQAEPTKSTKCVGGTTFNKDVLPNTCVEMQNA